METISFYEDAKKIKKIYTIVTILFYIGFLSGLVALFFNRAINIDFLNQYSFSNGEDIIITVFCASFSLFFTLYLQKSKKFKYRFSIANDKIEFSFDSNNIEYNTNDIVGYKVEKKRFGFFEFNLTLTEKRVLLIITKKGEELKNVLDKIEMHNIVLGR